MMAQVRGQKVPRPGEWGEGTSGNLKWTSAGSTGAKKERALGYRAEEICSEPGDWELLKDSDSELGKVLST